MNKTIYCISGLGADEQLFKYLDIPGYSLQVLQWPQYRPVDNLVSYAYKLSEQITGPDPILLGVSFGGMLAIEIAKRVSAAQTFLISSVQSAKDLPFYYRWAGSLSLPSLIPDVLINEPSEIQEHLFGVEGEEDKTLLRRYLINADPVYIRWGLRVILEWENEDFPLNVVHIHGTNDRVIPIPTGVHFRVQEGGHLMVFNKAAEVSRLIAQNIR